MRHVLGALVALLAMTLAACGGGEDRAIAWNSQAVGEATMDLPFQPLVVNSNLGVGETRLSFGLIDPERGPVGGAEVTVRLFRLADDLEANPSDATLVSEVVLAERALVTSTPHQHGDGSVHDHTGIAAAVYVANTSFDRVGFWGAALDITLEGEQYRDVPYVFFVSERTSEPMIGEAAPASVQLLAADVAEVAEIDSSLPPNPELHQITIADAISNGRPTLVAFVTPLFCQSRFCGPVLDNVILPAHELYRDRVDFVHIEPFDLPTARSGGGLVSSPTTTEWQLLGEPAVFVLDASGVVTAKFEGIMELVEITNALDEVLAGG